ncbi:ABC transporter domain-containing protein [Psidium guajava]|nr:ABC transporter domain-containing protein [Psidium guajava]
MANYTSLHLLFLLVLLFSSHEVEKRCALGRGRVNREEDDKYVVERKSLTPATTCKIKQGTWIDTGTQARTLLAATSNRGSRDSRIIFLRDQARVRSMNTLGQSRPLNAGNYDDHTQLPKHGGSPGAGEFVVTVGLGTPKVNLTLIFDTGSDITWTQCHPCPSCYHQKGPLFEPSESTTSSKPPCSTSKCTYSIDYADGSHSDGYYVRDLLTLTPKYKLPNFIFGCGQNNSHDFGTTAGMLGLGQGRPTLISQISSKFSPIFCYCIPSSESTNGYLHFGPDALRYCQTDSYTPIISDPKNPSFYFVNLVGIAFGNQKFSLSSVSTS